MQTSELQTVNSLIENLTQLREKHWLRVGMQRFLWHIENAEYAWDHQTGGRIPSKDMWRVNRFCVQDIVLGIVVLRHDRRRNRIDVDVFLTASIPEYEEDSGARALTLLILSDAYASGSRMEIFFTPNVEGGSVPGAIVELADKFNIQLNDAENGIIRPSEAISLYVALTGFSQTILDLFHTLESKGRISQAQVCFAINNGLWDRVEVEAILLSCPNPGAIISGKDQPEDRHLLLHDLQYGRSALLLGNLDRHLRYRAHPSGDKVALLEDDERMVEMELDANNLLAKFKCYEDEIEIPWIIKPYSGSLSRIVPGQPFGVLIRPRSTIDLSKESEKDIARANWLAEQTSNLPIYVLFTRDFDNLPTDHRQRLLTNSTGVGIMVYPEFALAMNDEIIRRIRGSKGKHE